ncbi:hypothetical protein [Methylibium sp.]|uniref:hypothetical protein n=1 Tax=Methylibium sp. TaxID=2067992 RepID=UPI0017AB304E|nr:hypothetical protein [Methylibium sp.]MBA3588495.1 hypothetical protein [Methylibium sp.]
MSRDPFPYVAFGLAALFGGLAVFASNMPDVPTAPPSPSPPPRFTSEYIGRVATLITDRQTGRQYLASSDGGIIEVDPTKRGVE